MTLENVLHGRSWRAEAMADPTGGWEIFAPISWIAGGVSGICFAEEV